MKALRIADRHDLTPFVSNQVHYSPYTREIENEIVPVAVDRVSASWSGAQSSAGCCRASTSRVVEAPAGSRHLTEWSEPPIDNQEKLYDIIEELRAIAEGYGVSAAQVAPAYTMAKPAVTSLIVGARTEDQLADNLAAADLEPAAADIDRLDAVSAQALPYPFWHHLNARDRLSPGDLTLLPRHLDD